MKFGGKLKLLIVASLISFAAFLIPILCYRPVAADYSWGAGTTNAGGSCGTTQNYHWDTCFGLSLQYYEWPANANSDITFYCTGNTGCANESTRVHVDKACKEYGGFWYLGYHVYSPNKSLTNVLNMQVGKPRIADVNSWANVSAGLDAAHPGNNTSLYPLGRYIDASHDYRNSDFKNANMATLTHNDIIAKGYTTTTCPGINYFGSNRQLCAKIDGTSTPVNAKYYGTISEIFDLWNSQVHKSNAENFYDVNWFCSADPDKWVEGAVNVTVGSEVNGSTAWEDPASNNHTATYTGGPLYVFEGGSKTINYNHYLRGNDNKTTYNITGYGGANAGGTFTPNANASAKVIATRSSTKSYADISTAATGSTFCDQLDYTGGGKLTHNRQACVNLRRAVANNSVKSRSVIKYGSSEAATNWLSSGTGSNSLSQIGLNFTSTTATQNVALYFKHSIMTDTAGYIGGVTYTVQQSTNGGSSWSNVSSSNYNFGTASANASADVYSNYNGTAVNITVNYNTNQTVCQRLTATYNGTSRTSTVCVAIKGSMAQGNIAQQSTVKYGNDTVSTSWISSGSDTNKVLEKTVTLTAPSQNVTVYFTHAVTVSTAGNINNISWSYSGDGASAPTSGTYTGLTGYRTSGSANIKDGIAVTVTVSENATTTVCQTFNVTYSNARSTKVCAKLTGSLSRSNVKGVSTIKAVQGSATQSDSTDAATANTTKTKNLGTITVKMNQGETKTLGVHFSHAITPTGTGYVGNVGYKIEQTTNGGSSWSGVANTSYNFGYVNSVSTATVYNTLSGNASVSLTVSPTTNQTVCQKMTITYNNAITLVCATIKGALVEGDITQGSTVKYGSDSSTTNGSGTTTLSKTVTLTEPSQNVTVYFTHFVKVSSTGNIGNIAWSISGDSVGTPTSGTYTGLAGWKTANTSGNIRADIPVTVTVNDGQTSTVCQTLGITYGSNRSTKVCASLTGSLAKGDISSFSSVIVDGTTTSTDYATKSSPNKSKEINVTVPIENMTATKTVTFKHSALVSTTGYFTAMPYVITENSNQKTTGNLTSFNGYKIASSTAPVDVATYSVTKELSHNETARVCQAMKITSQSVDRTSTICVNLTGKYNSRVDAQSKVSLNAGGTTTEATQKTVKGGSLKYVTATAEQGTVTFTHDIEVQSSTSLTQPYEIVNDFNSSYNKSGSVTATDGVNTAQVVNTYPIKEGDGWMCETLRYTYKNDNYSSRVCAFIDNVPTSQSEDCPVHNGSTNPYSISQVRKGGEAGIWQSEVYAKPTDFLDFRHCYYPAASSAISPWNSFNVGNLNINDKMQNTYTLTLDGSFRTDFTNNGGYVQFNGHDTVPTYAVTKTVPGNKIRTAALGSTVDQSLYLGTQHSTASSTARAIVPYNYETTGTINASTSEYVYAGARVNVSDITITVSPRNNSLVGETYATKTPESTVRLYMLVGNGTDISGGRYNLGSSTPCTYYTSTVHYTSCTQVNERTQVYNESGNLNGATSGPGFTASEYNIPDLPAGTKICFGLSIYPASSTDSVAIDGTTYLAKPVCKTIAKRPTFQVWGGSLYAAGNVTTSETIKYFDANGNVQSVGGTRRVFGSWVENSIVASGNVRGISSGAATNYTEANLAPDDENGGNTVLNTYCSRSILTFANSSCGGGTAGVFGTPSRSSATKDSVLQQYAPVAATTNNFRTDNTTTLDVSTDYEEVDGVRYTFVDANGDGIARAIITASSPLPKNTTHIIYVKNDVMIDSNLTYTTTGLNTISDIPQYVVISEKGSVYTSANPDRVDSLIIANDTFSTCGIIKGDGTFDHRNECHKQLRINGVVIAKKMKLGRTYGAESGNGTLIPAEIINFVPTSFFWQNGIGAGAGSTSTYTSYIRELAPRQ